MAKIQSSKLSAESGYEIAVSLNEVQPLRLSFVRVGKP
ncbi:unnamed protein product [Arabidopsis halleri]